MELRHIRSFLAIAETLHFGRTAELIHLSQPALSLQIRALEEEVGVRLFERNRRKTTLTAAGAAFRDDAAAALSQLEQAIRRARLAANGKMGRLREVAGENFVMSERTWAPGFHDLMFGILRDAAIVPNVTQTVGEIPTLISLVHSGMGITIAPLSVVIDSVPSVVICEILDRIPMCEIGMAVSKRVRAAVVDNFRSFALTKLGRARKSLRGRA